MIVMLTLTQYYVRPLANILEIKCMFCYTYIVATAVILMRRESCMYSKMFSPKEICVCYSETPLLRQPLGLGISALNSRLVFIWG